MNATKEEIDAWFEMHFNAKTALKEELVALRAENTKLRETLRDVVTAIGTPRTVYIGFAQLRYEVTFQETDNPIEVARALLAKVTP